MGVRIRNNGKGKILNARMYEERYRDIYIDDNLLYLLSEKGVLVTEAMRLDEGVGRGGHEKHGEWWWNTEVPEDVKIDNYYKKM